MRASVEPTAPVRIEPTVSVASVSRASAWASCSSSRARAWASRCRSCSVVVPRLAASALAFSRACHVRREPVEGLADPIEGARLGLGLLGLGLRAGLGRRVLPLGLGGLRRRVRHD